MMATRALTVSGLPGSGTSTVCQRLSKEIGWTYLNTGEMFRQMAEEAGLSLAEFGRRAEGDAEVDRQLDARMVRQALEVAGGVVLEGRLTGWMAVRHEFEALKVWLDAAIEVRAERVGQREDQSREEALAAINQRERSERKRYLENHAIEIADLSIYDLVIDSAELGPEEIVARISAALIDGG